jgi:hypothetical protein
LPGALTDLKGIPRDNLNKFVCQGGADKAKGWYSSALGGIGRQDGPSGSRRRCSSVLDDFGAKRAHMNPGDVTAVPSSAVAAKGAHAELGGAQAEPEQIPVPPGGGVTKIIREGHDIASAVSWEADQKVMCG